MAYYQHVGRRRKLIVGFHGTSASAAYASIAKGFTANTGPNEWLERGVYFWAQIDTAWLWGGDRHKKCAGVEASLVPGNCLDLDNTHLMTAFLPEVASELDLTLFRERRVLPPSSGGEQRYTCELLNHAALSTSPVTDSIVRTCPAGSSIVANSDLRAATRLQICIRNLNQILNPVLRTERS